ncbi:MAG: hypothetical protein CMN75_09835 [Spirochaeta sp.]|nr:hypothetical protein [Spirochaeta sp.]
MEGPRFQIEDLQSLQVHTQRPSYRTRKKVCLSAHIESLAFCSVSILIASREFVRQYAREKRLR